MALQFEVYTLATPKSLAHACVSASARDCGFLHVERFSRRCTARAHRCTSHVGARTWLYGRCAGRACSYRFTYRNTWKSVCRVPAKRACFWLACGAVRVVRVNIDATVFCAVRSGRSSPRLQGVSVFIWQLSLWRGPAESAPAPQAPTSRAGMEAALQLLSRSYLSSLSSTAHIGQPYPLKDKPYATRTHFAFGIQP